MRNIIASCLAVVMLAFMGFGKAQAQNDQATATVTGKIEITAPLTLSSSSATIDFGTQLPGTGAITVPAGGSASQGSGSQGSSITVEGADGASVGVSWTSPSDFAFGGWSPIISESQGSTSGMSSGSNITLGGGATTLYLGGTTTVPSTAEEGTSEQDFTLTVTYNSL